MKRFFILFLLMSQNVFAGVIVSDAFTETSTVALASHTPTTAGTSWVEDQDTCTSTYNADASDFARPNADLTDCIMMYSARPNPTVTRYDVQVDFIDASTVASTDCMGISARWTDSSNYYSLGVCDDSGLNYRLYKNVAAVKTSLATGGAFSNNNTDTIIFQVINKAKRVFENGTQIISNTDNTLTSAGQAGIWCGQVQVAGDDCDTTGQRFDNFSVTTYPRQIVDLDFATEAFADIVHDGRWYLSPVVKVGDVRTPKIFEVDKTCAASADIGDSDVPNEWSLVYVKCQDYSKLDSDQSLTFVHDGDINKRVSDLSGYKITKLEKIIKEKNPKANLKYSKSISDWLTQLGRVIKPEFNADELYVR